MITTTTTNNFAEYVADTMYKLKIQRKLDKLGRSIYHTTQNIISQSDRYNLIKNSFFNNNTNTNTNNNNTYTNEGVALIEEGVDLVDEGVVQHNNNNMNNSNMNNNDDNDNNDIGVLLLGQVLQKLQIIISNQIKSNDNDNDNNQ
jgi:hypothetical protein